MELSRRSLLKGLISLSIFFFNRSAWGKVCFNSSTLEQSLGPFYPDPKDPEFPVKENLELDLSWIEANDNDLTFVKGLRGKAKGQIIYLAGRCLDENCKPIIGAKIFLWQANAFGRYNHLGDREFARFKNPQSGELIEYNESKSTLKVLFEVFIQLVFMSIFT